MQNYVCINLYVMQKSIYVVKMVVVVEIWLMLFFFIIIVFLCPDLLSGFILKLWKTQDAFWQPVFIAEDNVLWWIPEFKSQNIFDHILTLKWLKLLMNRAHTKWKGTVIPTLKFSKIDRKFYLHQEKQNKTNQNKTNMFSK